MKICLEVTWPIRKSISLPRSQTQAKKLRQLNLRKDLICVINGELCIHGLFGCENKVPDVDRYKIVRCGRRIAVEDHQLTAGDINLSTNPYIDRQTLSGYEQPTLVIVLESPHRDEYGSSVDKPITPARGATGVRIHKYLCHVLNGCHELSCLLSACAPVRVIISNPIPFQTSAYAIHGGRLNNPEGLRNFIWPALWCLKDCNSEGNDEYVFQRKFCNNLSRYNPIAIINACTKGNERRDKVTAFLRDWRECHSDQSVQIYTTDHPSAWKNSTTLSAA